MAENSNIEWTHHTFNPWEGCQKVGPGCDHCYAEARDQRFTGGAHWGPGAPRRRTSPQNWAQPLKWDRAAQRDGTRARVFCASLADVFDNAVDPAWRDDLWRLIAATPHLDWMLLTKRPGNIAKMLPPSWGNGWHNVWLGCTVVNQEEADRDVPKLLAVPARVRFLSMEPLLGPVDLAPWLDPDKFCEGCDDGEGYGNRCNRSDIPRSEQCPWQRAVQTVTEHGPVDEHGMPAGVTCVTEKLDCVIVGGESGPGARPMHPDWPRQIRDQCVAAGVAYFFKQWGEWKPLNQTAFGEDEAYYHPAPERHPDADRRCKHDSLCLAPDGTSFSMGSAQQYHRIEDGAFMGRGHMTCFKVGKKAAGRHLDGRTWDQMPEVRNG